MPFSSAPKTYPRVMVERRDRAGLGGLKPRINNLVAVGVVVAGKRG
jgi:hypothetical protein